MATISVLTVSYNTKAILEQYLRSLLASQVDDHTLEVIIVDNASEDGSAAMVSEKFPHVTLIANQDNVGFGKANNQAYAKSHGEYIFVCNPDTMLGPTVIAELLTQLQSLDNAGIVAPKLQFADGTLQPSCYNLPTISRAIAEFFFGKAGTYLKYAPKSDRPIAVEAVVGAAMLLSRKTIEQLGTLFDEKFYFYYEDIDLCRRIRSLHKTIYYIPGVTMTHLHGESAKKRGSWAYEQNQRSAKIYFGPVRYAIITAILKYGQKWQKLLRIIGIKN